jgi:protease-4
MAKLETYQLKEYPEKKGVLDRFLNNYANEVKIKTVKEEIGEEQYAILQQLRNLRNMISVPQTRLPFQINVR